MDERALRDFTFEAWAWLMESFGGTAAWLARSHLVVVGEDDFPVDASLDGLDLAYDYLAFVKEHAGAPDLEFELEPATENPAALLRGIPHHMTEGLVPVGPQPTRPAGAPLLVRVRPESLDDPATVVAVLARGVAWYLVKSPRRKPPGGPELASELTDVAAAWLGFGAITANVAFRAAAYSRGGMIGFARQRIGALPQHEITASLALFAELHGLDDADVLPLLSENPAGWLPDLRSAVRRDPRLASLRAIPATERGPYR